MTHDNRQLRHQIAANWGDHTHQPLAAVSASAAQRLEKYRPTTWKKVAAWISVGIGTFALLSSFASMEDYAGMDMVRYLLGSALLSLMLALPGTYWLLRNNSDQLTAQGWVEREKSREQLAKVLVGRERDLLGDAEAPPLLRKRRWVVIVGVMFVLLVAGGGVLPPAV